MMATDITSIPQFLKNRRFMPLAPGTKVPLKGVDHATWDEAAPWDASVDEYLGKGGMRVGVFMGDEYLVLDADIKMGWEDDGDGVQHAVVVKNGNDIVYWLMSLAGITELPPTTKIKTQGGGTHWWFRQNPECRISQKKIESLDVKAHRNAYCAIGEGYVLLEDAEIPVIPLALARVLVAAKITASKEITLSEDGKAVTQYGDIEHGFNNLLTSFKGEMIKRGFTNEAANAAVWELNINVPDPISREKFDETIGRDKGWTQGEFMSDDIYDWAMKQAGLTVEDVDAQKYLDVGTVKRLWTTDRYREFQALQAIQEPVRERLEEVVLEPAPPSVIDGLVTIGLYGVAGPPESGKSLLTKDWANAVANGLAWQGYHVPKRRSVTVVISEGHHDLAARWARVRKDEIFIYRTPILLTNEFSVEQFLKQHEGSDTGLVIFDLIYHMGIIDDNKSVDVAPVLKACRLLSRELQCAVLVVGHPGHATGRRFRGTSIWRDWFDGEFHMANDMMTCEKHKYARKETMEWPYETAWPQLHFLDVAQYTGKKAREDVIRQELMQDPTIAGRQLAARLAQERSGVGEEAWRKQIQAIRNAMKKDGTIS